jgi:hypothetical protein
MDALRMAAIRLFKISKMKFSVSSVLCVVLFLVLAGTAEAHHVLGRPSYALDEESNTPPSMQVETQIGKFYITYMVFPAFPEPNERGRLNLYASRVSNGDSYDGKVTFKVRDDSWFTTNEETLGTQPPDDSVFRQGFVFKEAGDYIVTAEFRADGEPYVIDFPLTIGKPFPVGPVGIAAAVIFVGLVGVNLWQRRRLNRLQTARHHHDQRKAP